MKTKPEYNKVAGCFILRKGEEVYLFANGGVNLDPSAEDFAETAIQTAETAKKFGIDPKVAMLSFSTMGSASSDEVTKVQEATKLAKEKAPDLAVDGELQFDAAFTSFVGPAYRLAQFYTYSSAAGRKNRELPQNTARMAAPHAEV